MSGLKSFPLADVLSITTGRLLSRRGMDAIYNILDYMSEEGLTTLQLPRVAEEARPVIIALYPQLSKENLKSDLDALDAMKGAGAEAVYKWVDDLKGRLGETFKIPKLGDAHKKIDPITEAINMTNGTLVQLNA